MNLDNYHIPTWSSVQIRMLAMGHWRLNDAVPRIAYTRIHRYIEWVLTSHETTGMDIDACLLMHPTESLLWLDKSRWFRPLPLPTCLRDVPDQVCDHFDDPGGMCGLIGRCRGIPLHIRPLIAHLDSSHTIVVSEHAMSTMGKIVDMIIIDAAYSAFIPEEGVSSSPVVNIP